MFNELNFVDQGQFGSGIGFSGYLSALSRVSADEVWLKKVDLASGFMRLEGSSLREEKVPVYFQSFESEPLFKGMNFDVFEISRSKDYDWKVDFIIACKIQTTGSVGQ